MKIERNACAWTCPEGDPALEREIAAALRCSPLLARLLWNRGVRSVQEAERFLQAKLTDLVPPEAFNDMARAVARIRAGLARREKIAVFGDYDADGVSATAILMLFFSHLGAQAQAFLPHRVNDGYGLSLEAVRRMHAWGANLVITVDNGIGSAKEVAFGRGLGLDFIITDHHEAAGPLPAEVPILNPKTPGERYPFRDLAGAGVAFKLMWALARELSGQAKVSEAFRALLLRSIALACLGTVADVVPLLGENRIITHHGLRFLREQESAGLKALKTSACGLDSALRAHDIAFRLGPRLNAAGRLGDPGRALELLLTDDPARAADLALELDKENDRRRRIEEGIISQARAAAVEARRGDTPCIVLANPEWHAGVIGIAAARIAEEFARPTVLIALEGDSGRGSGRTAGGVALYEVIEAARSLLDDFGGHAEACGLRIKAAHVAPFAERLGAIIRARYPVLRETFTADAVMPPDSLTPAIIAECAGLAPFGEDNRPPVFIAERLATVGEVQRMGRTRSHLAFFVRSGRAAFRTVYFGGTADADRIAGPLTFAYEPRLNTFNGAGEIELNLKRIL